MKVIQKGEAIGLVSVERVAHNMASWHFTEISSGIYYVEKDRFDTYKENYVTSKKVAKAMSNFIQPASIKRLDGSLILNRPMISKLKL